MNTEMMVAKDVSSWELIQRQAEAFAKSELVPETYKGKIANVLVAMNVANRLSADVFMVMQNLYIVKGRPAFSAQFVIAAVNARGTFSPLRFETEGSDNPHNKAFRCRALATDKATGEVCVGEWIDWQMVDGEKWGPKWQTMPGQMFRYRAAAFWARVYCPEATMGFPTVEEAEDFAPVRSGGRPLAQLTEAMTQQPPTVDAVAEGEG